MDGRAPIGMDAATAALFPSLFEDSQLGPIPKGWTRQSLEDLANSPITYGVVKPGPEAKDGILLVRSGDIVDGWIHQSTLRTVTTTVSDQYRRTLLRGRELLVALVGNPGDVAIVPDSLAGANIARQVGMIRLRYPSTAVFVWLFLRSPAGQMQMFSSSRGSVQQVINLGDLRKIHITWPGERVVLAALSYLQPFYDRCLANEVQSKTLASLRSLLLPKLLSGELRIRDAEREVEKVA